MGPRYVYVTGMTIRERNTGAAEDAVTILDS